MLSPTLQSIRPGRSQVRSDPPGRDPRRPPPAAALCTRQLAAEARRAFRGAVKEQRLRAGTGKVRRAPEVKQFIFRGEISARHLSPPLDRTTALRVHGRQGPGRPPGRATAAGTGQPGGGAAGDKGRGKENEGRRARVKRGARGSAGDAAGALRRERRGPGPGRCGAAWPGRGAGAGRCGAARGGARSGAAARGGPSLTAEFAAPPAAPGAALCPAPPGPAAAQ